MRINAEQGPSYPKTNELPRPPENAPTPLHDRARPTSQAPSLDRPSPTHPSPPIGRNIFLEPPQREVPPLQKLDTGSPASGISPERNTMPSVMPETIGKEGVKTDQSSPAISPSGRETVPIFVASPASTAPERDPEQKESQLIIVEAKQGDDPSGSKGNVQEGNGADSPASPRDPGDNRGGSGRNGDPPKAGGTAPDEEPERGQGRRDISPHPSRSLIHPFSRVDITTVRDVPPYYWSLTTDLDEHAAAQETYIGLYRCDPSRLIQVSEHSLVVGAYTPTNEPVAIKISRMSNPQATRVLEREASFHEIAASVTDNVPRIIESGTLPFLVKPYYSLPSPTNYFGVLVTELIPGKDLLDIGFKHLDISQVKRRYTPLAHAIDVIGQAGIVHRDIKRGNIIIDNDGIARLIDFGIATTVGTAPDVIFGAPSSRSPEHEIRGAPLTEATNVFQFGLLIYRELTGGEMMPYIHTHGYDLTQLLEANQFETHVQRRLRWSNLPRHLLPLFSKIFALDPAERPTAVEFITELGKY